MGQVKVVNHRESRVVLSRAGNPLPDGRVVIDELVLEGGANLVDDARLKLFTELPNNKRLFDHGLLVAEGAYVEGKEDKLPAYGGDLSKLSVKAALRTIKACKDPRQLRVWIKQDGRPEIRAALIARHAELEKESGEGDSGQGDKEDN